MTKHRVYSLVCLAAAMLVAPAVASAQALGVGLTITRVRGDVPGSTDPARLVGGVLRIISSKHTTRSHRGSMWSGWRSITGQSAS
jgi:hypothetical protein